MALLHTANFALSFGTERRTFGDRLDDTVLSVKDFGAVGDGVADDGPAIQLAFDTLFGEYGDVHGGYGNGAWLNKNLRFPPGDYKISYPLLLNNVDGARLLGAGSHQTRIFWDPLEPPVTDAVTVGGTPVEGYSSLIEARTAEYMNMEGITLDASNVQDVVYRLMTYPPVHPNGGTGGSYRDVHFTNTITGVLGGYGDYGGSTLSSEQIFTMCRFTNCSGWGLRTGHQNALNYSFRGCTFADCGLGYSSPQGGAGTLFFCHFQGNDLDFSAVEAQISVIGCDSTSQNFASSGGVIIGCKHFPPAALGCSVCLSATTIPLSGGPPWIESGAFAHVAVIGNHFGPDTFFADHTGNLAPPTQLHLLGNLLDNSPDCFDELNITVGDGEVSCWEDGVHVIAP